MNVRIMKGMVKIGRMHLATQHPRKLMKKATAPNAITKYAPNVWSMFKLVAYDFSARVKML